MIIDQRQMQYKRVLSVKIVATQKNDGEDSESNSDSGHGVVQVRRTGSGDIGEKPDIIENEDENKVKLQCGNENGRLQQPDVAGLADKYQENKRHQVTRKIKIQVKGKVNQRIIIIMVIIMVLGEDKQKHKR